MFFSHKTKFLQNAAAFQQLYLARSGKIGISEMQLFKFHNGNIGDIL